MEEEENKEYISYMFNTSYNYIINSNINGGKTFYKIPLKKKAFDGQIMTCNVPVRFAKCQPVPDGTIIRIKNAKEDWYVKNRFDTIVYLVIFDYEIVQTSDRAAQQALETFNAPDETQEDLSWLS